MTVLSITYIITGGLLLIATSYRAGYRKNRKELEIFRSIVQKGKDYNPAVSEAISELPRNLKKKFS